MRALPFLALTAGLLWPGASSAQQGSAGEPQTQAPPEVQDPQLVFEREVFSYPTFRRRNPFAPLLSDAAGPRFESMRLELVLYTADPRTSLALLSVGRLVGLAGEAGDAGGMTARLRVGERWGNVRVLEIRPNQIIVEIEEFGLTEQRTMDLPARGQGGSR
jgi:hypothetical protein